MRHIYYVIIIIFTSNCYTIRAQKKQLKREKNIENAKNEIENLKLKI